MAQSIRRAQRAYHCHACNKDFKQMVDLNDLASVKCIHCESDFLEEKRSFEAEPQPQAQPHPQPQPQPQPQQQNSQPRMSFSYQQQPQGFGQFSAQAQADSQSRQAPPQMRQQTFSRRYSPNGGWTQSVTVSFGPGGNGMQQQSQQIHVRQGGGAQMPASQMPAANEFASAAHAQQPQQPEQQQQQRAHPQQMGGFFSSSGPQMVDPFQQMDDFFQGPMQGMGGFFQRPQQRPQAQQQNPHQGFFQQMFGGEGGLGNVFFANGFPMDENRPGSRGGCTEDYIRNLPEKESGKESDCYICLDKCKEGKDSCQLPCGHAFDRDCITGWLKDHDSCPVCRVKLDQGRPQAQQNQQQQQNGQPNVFFL